MSIRRKDKRDANRFATRRVENEARQVISCAISHKRVVGSWQYCFSVLFQVAIGDVFHLGSDHFVCVVCDLLFFGFALRGNEGCNENAFRPIADRLSSAVAVFVF